MIPGFKLDQHLGVRPARASDQPFLASLYRSTRDDLRLIDAEDDVIEGLTEWQRQAQTTGYGDLFPNALYMVIEVQGERAGRLVLDFGPNEIRVVDIAFIPAARGKGYGSSLLEGLKRAAAQVRVPLALTVLETNPRARRLYHSLGFSVAATQPPFELMIWYPPAAV